MIRRHWSPKTRMAILNRFDRQCQLCRQSIIAAKGFDLDHHIPLAMGGEDREENLRPLCLPCHRLKTRGDVAAIAKAKRREARHWGVKRTSRPLPGGRNSPYRRKINGEVVLR